MPEITREELIALAQTAVSPCVTLYMPTHEKSRDVEQNPIRFKNLLREVATQLRNGHVTDGDAEVLLEPAWRLQRDLDFWAQQRRGLAVFLVNGGLRRYRLPEATPELAVVARRPYVTPLLPTLSGDGPFFVLALSQNELRLARCTRTSVQEAKLENVPTSLEEAMRFDDPEPQLQYRTGVGDAGATFHGHGGLADAQKDQLRRFCQQVDGGLAPLLRGERAPLVLAAVDYLQPIYRQANSYANLLDEGIPGSPDRVHLTELREKAWALLQPRLAAAGRQAVERYQQVAGSERASETPEHVLRAACGGKVGTLLINRDAGACFWGEVDERGHLRRRDEAPRPDSDELVSLAVLRTLEYGGQALALRGDQMPNGAPVAAIFRP